MTPELLDDIRRCVRSVWQSTLDAALGESAERVLAWLDEQERIHTPIMPGEGDEDMTWSEWDAIAMF